MLCKGQGESLDKCLRKMKPGYSTNGNRHLTDVHRDKIIEIEEAERVGKEVSV